jgi:hypothetical protein
LWSTPTRPKPYVVVSLPRSPSPTSLLSIRADPCGYSFAGLVASSLAIAEGEAAFLRSRMAAFSDDADGLRRSFNEAQAELGIIVGMYEECPERLYPTECIEAARPAAETREAPQIGVQSGLCPRAPFAGRGPSGPLLSGKSGRWGTPSGEATDHLSACGLGAIWRTMATSRLPEIISWGGYPGMTLE